MARGETIETIFDSDIYKGHDHSSNCSLPPLDWGEWVCVGQRHGT
jgi:hypothetical protein